MIAVFNSRSCRLQLNTKVVQTADLSEINKQKQKKRAQFIMWKVARLRLHQVAYADYRVVEVYRYVRPGDTVK